MCEVLISHLFSVCFHFTAVTCPCVFEKQKEIPEKFHKNCKETKPDNV